jgi:hypothetical protein
VLRGGWCVCRGEGGCTGGQLGLGDVNDRREPQLVEGLDSGSVLQVRSRRGRAEGFRVGSCGCRALVSLRTMESYVEPYVRGLPHVAGGVWLQPHGDGGADDELTVVTAEVFNLFVVSNIY